MTRREIWLVPVVDLGDTGGQFPNPATRAARHREQPLPDNLCATNLLVATMVGSMELPTALTATLSRRRSLDYVLVVETLPEVGLTSAHAADSAGAWITAILAGPQRFRGKRFVHAFTSRFRGDTAPSASAAWRTWTGGQAGSTS